MINYFKNNFNNFKVYIIKKLTGYMFRIIDFYIWREAFNER